MRFKTDKHSVEPIRELLGEGRISHERAAFVPLIRRSHRQRYARGLGEGFVDATVFHRGALCSFLRQRDNPETAL